MMRPRAGGMGRYCCSGLGFGLAPAPGLQYIALVRRAVIDHAPGAVSTTCSRFVFEPGLPDTDRAAGPGAFAAPV